MSDIVIIYNISSQQKSKIIKEIKNKLKNPQVLLAIGDGINDVDMIRESDIGLGIINKRINDAANNSDIAIGEFM